MGATSGSDDDKKDLARGTGDVALVDYDFIKCGTGGSGGMSDMLPLMMMGGAGGAGGMDPMMMMLMMGDDSSSSMKDMLPLMMMSGGMGGAGGAGGMDPMMMMMLMDDSDDSSTRIGCDDKHKVDHAFTSAGKITDASAIRAAVLAGTITGPSVKSTWETEYAACLAGASSEGSTSSPSS